ncbi:MAG: OFA family MFS transporter [Peptococcaceae bacterium]|jgi:MFS family permease|nr:OFA family MFS transporter [Peptococcaceae bacterium]MDH7525432.1 OFA family MFS transporter [Peptococcaceae bacterium]
MKHGNKGWLVTGCAVGINLACGMLYSWSVYAAALVKELGFTKTQATLPYTIALAMLALLSIPGGRLQDRFGARLCATVCGILCGAGLIICGFTSSTAILIVGFGIIAGSGIGLGYGATTPSAVKWFPPQKRGFISGLVVGGVGLAPVYVAPMTQYFVNSFGVKQTFLIEGLVFGAVILVLSQFLANPPAGYIPPGMPEQAGADGVASKRDFTPLEMSKTVQFWLIWGMLACGALAGLMIIGHIALIAKVQADIDWAFAFVAMLAIFNAGGRVVGGLISDRVGRRTALLLVFAFQAANMLLFKYYTTAAWLVLGIAIAGTCYGSLLAIFPALTFDYYGMKNGGVNYGIVFSAWGVAGVIGPIMAGYVVDLTKSYHAAYLIAACLLVISLALVMMLKPPKAATAGEEEG